MDDTGFGNEPVFFYLGRFINRRSPQGK